MENLGSAASIIGLVVSIIGFIITIQRARQAKTASEEARDAVEDVRSRFAMNNIVRDLSTAINVIDEIKRLQRLRSWQLLPDRYSDLRRKLAAVKSFEDILDDGEMTILQKSMIQAKQIEMKIEGALDEMVEGNPLVPSKLNKLLSTELDSLYSLLVSLQNRIGVSDGLRQDH